jgi:membrane protease subunit (stomatin/prohibitin family)
MKGVGMGAGMGIGQELTGTLIQHVRNRGQGGAPGAPAQQQAQGGWDIQCSCGAVNTADSRFCGQCGGTLVQRCMLSGGTKCSCGYTNAQGQKFCSECGNKLG